MDATVYLWGKSPVINNKHGEELCCIEGIRQGDFLSYFYHYFR